MFGGLHKQALSYWGLVIWLDGWNANLRVGRGGQRENQSVTKQLGAIALFTVRCPRAQSQCVAMVHRACPVYQCLQRCELGSSGVTSARFALQQQFQTVACID